MKAPVTLARGDKTVDKARKARYHMIQTNTSCIVAGCNQLDTLVRRWENDSKTELPWAVHIIDTHDDNTIVWDSTGTIERKQAQY